MPTYSFLDVQAAIAGPGGIINLGNGAGVAEEGITVTMSDDKDTMTTGADGEVMHALNGSKSGTMTVRLLKTSATNALLTTMYYAQTITSATHGINTITVRDSARGDNITGQQAAFRKLPSVAYNKAGPMNEWEFNVGKIDMLLGAGAPASS